MADEHPSDLIERGKHYPEVVQALKECKEMLVTKTSYQNDSVGLKGINMVLKESEVYL